LDEKGAKIPNQEVVGATIEYFDNATENNHLTDVADVEERATIRTRGASSRSFDG
jgi:hypothetical protein